MDEQEVNLENETTETVVDEKDFRANFMKMAKVFIFNYFKGEKIKNLTVEGDKIGLEKEEQKL